MASGRRPTTNDQPPTTGSCLLYYITDRTAFPGDECARRLRLLEKISEAGRAGVEYIQLREKDLSTRALASLARDAVGVIEQLRTGNRELRTALLINSRTDVALAAGADGVHLRSDDISPQQVRKVWQAAQRLQIEDLRSENLKRKQSAIVNPKSEISVALASPEAPLIGVSCHSPAEIDQAVANGASFAVLAPVFEKKDAPGAQPAGLAMLRQACRATIPVLALGGITLANARSCLEAGAAGIAAIRLFQENDISEVVRHLRQ